MCTGDTVEVRKDDRVVGRGTVDDYSSKRDIVWIRLSDCNERRIFLRSDEIEIHIL